MGESKNALVVGLGRSGRAAARFLLARGDRVTATDALPVEQLDRETVALGAAGVRLACGGHDARDFAAADLVVLSPGVPVSLPELDAARARGVPIVSELDLVAERVGARAVLITGSNGKTTTTALVAEMLKAAGRDAVACGNYGLPLVDAVQGDGGARWYAIEISSFQLETTHALRAAAAILLNIQADHLDRHGSFEAYRAAKYRVAEDRAKGAPLVLGGDDPELAPLAASARPPVLRVSAHGRVAAGGFVEQGELRLAVGGREETLAGVSELQLPGRHNRVNVLAAAVALRAAGLPLEPLRRAALAFTPLPHRLQEVALVRGVRFVDDSKGTNVGAVLEALVAMRETLAPGARIYTLLGGRDKDSDFRPLAAALAQQGGIAVTFGEAGPRIAAALEAAGSPVVRRGALADAVAHAASLAAPGDLVLLSPACASFDAFTGYAARGDAFAAAARALAAETSR
jgi:UDP-N-acetylmuramoylalanine--D-glutamate ligase